MTTSTPIISVDAVTARELPHLETYGANVPPAPDNRLTPEAQRELYDEWRESRKAYASTHFERLREDRTPSHVQTLRGQILEELRTLTAGTELATAWEVMRVMYEAGMSLREVLGNARDLKEVSAVLNYLPPIWRAQALTHKTPVGQLNADLAELESLALGNAQRLGYDLTTLENAETVSRIITTLRDVWGALSSNLLPALQTVNELYHASQPLYDAYGAIQSDATLKRSVLS